MGTSTPAEMDETAIGYRLASETGDTDNLYGVHLNAAKSEKVVFGEKDFVIVLSED